MPTLPSALIRPTAPPESDGAEVQDVEASESAEGQGRGAQEAPVPARPRRARGVAKAEKTSKRGLYLTDSVWEKLQLEAIRNRTNVSAIAGKVLEKNLPRLRIERDA
jgi:hypothetical protein